MTSVRSCSFDPLRGTAVVRWNRLFVGRRQRDGRAEDADGVFAKQGRQVHRADHRIRSEGPGYGQAARRYDRLGIRPRR